MPNKIERLCTTTPSIDLTNSEATTSSVSFSPYAGGTVFVGSVAGATSINWYVGSDASATCVPLYSGGAAVTTSIAANQAYPLPDELYSAPYFKAVLDAGTASVVISLKG